MIPTTPRTMTTTQRPRLSLGRLDERPLARSLKPSLKPGLLLSLLLSLTLGLGLLGCQEPHVTAQQAAPLIDTWAQGIGAELKERAATSATSQALKAALEAKMAHEREGLAKDTPPLAQLAHELYSAREFKTGLFKAGQLTPSGEALLAQLERVHEDALDPKPYQLSKVRQQLDQIKALRQQYDALGGYVPGQAERDHLMAWLTAKKAAEVTLGPELLPALTQDLMGSPAGEPLRATVARYGELSEQIASASAQVELTLAMGLLRYAHAMRDHRLPQIFVHERQDDRYNDPETKGRRPVEAQAAYLAGTMWRRAAFLSERLAKQEAAPLLRRRMVQTLAQTLEGGHEAALAGLQPSPDYVALRKERARYQKIVDAGGWAEVSEIKNLKPGMRAPAIKALKQRLATEGYLDASQAVSELHDAALTQAILDYQRTHQLDEDGKPGKTFWRSLNVSAQERLAQIELNMRRWRHSDVQHHDHDLYITVNIPDFHAEIWKKQQQVMRMRIVVGNNDQAEDEDKKKIHPNRTPTLSAYIDRVIYNPYWNVTPRIRQEETLVDVRKDLEQRYVAKLQKLLGGEAASPTGPVGPASPTGAVMGAQSAGQRSFTRKSPEGLVFDVEGIRSAYYAKHQAELDLKAQLPYLNEQSGLVDVSVTDPKNIPPWYAANGYEVMHPGKSWEFVRQLNGKDNALGRVKIIFPNLHDVYLHDTQAKELFKKTTRAYSHGCMRMHKPLEFAQWLLEEDGSWDERHVRKILADVTYEPIFLKRRVPVHIIYHTVRADEQGRANFLLDVYGYDRERKLRP